jgi:hypothetical protein
MKSSSKKLNPVKLVISGTIIIALAIVAWGGYVFFSKPLANNYAQEIAQPLENALARAGAKKACGYGDSGRGWDNQRPWYGSYYEFRASREKAIEMINNVAKESGYSLIHASKDNQGPLLRPYGQNDPIAGIDNWFFDNTSKTIPYSDLKPGRIELTIDVSNGRSYDVSCNTSSSVKVEGSDSSSVIDLNVKLTDFKKQN